MFGDGRRELQRTDVLRGIDRADKFVDVTGIPQGLDAARGCARADGHQLAALPPDLLDALGIVVRRDRPLHQTYVVRTLHRRPRSFGKVGDLHRARHGQQFVFGIEQTQLAAVARSELEHGDLRFFRPLEFMLSYQSSHLLVRKDWAVFADEIGTVLAMPTESHRAFHVSLHR
jgi:hypothetical protein